MLPVVHINTIKLKKEVMTESVPQFKDSVGFCQEIDKVGSLNERQKTATSTLAGLKGT